MSMVALTSSTTVESLLLKVQRKVEFLTRQGTPRERNCMYFSVGARGGNDAALGHPGGGTTSIFPTGPNGPEDLWPLVAATTTASLSADAAVGALVGLVLGDAFGAPLEFLPVQCDPKLLHLPSFSDAQPQRTAAAPTSPPSPRPRLTNHPHLILTPPTARTDSAGGSVVVDSKAVFQYYKPCNRFGLRLGQWTDDASMALCLADSLLVTALTSSPTQSSLMEDPGRASHQPLTSTTSASSIYHDGDCRIRYCNWWFHGYNNAFRHDRKRQTSDSCGTSVGLGGNISASLYALEREARQLASNSLPVKRGRDDSKKATDAEEAVHLTRDDAANRTFKPSEENADDSGNGSLMRLAPAAIRCWSNGNLAQSVGEKSSYTTHGGEEAAAACRFVSFFVSRAILEADSRGGKGDRPAMPAFMDVVIAEFIAEVCRRGEESGPPYVRLLALLRGQPPSSKEACWAWKSPLLPVQAALVARGSRYQGYPVSSGYFGSYALDGLAMALWAMHGGGSEPTFLGVLYRVVNLLGDSDSTAAITCQMAGAFFGFKHISGAAPTLEYRRHASSPTQSSSPEAAEKDAEGERMILKTMMSCLKVWDPHGEIGARGVLLHHLGRKLSA